MMEKNYLKKIALFAVGAMFAASHAQAQGPVTTQTFAYSGSIQNFTVPSLCVNQITVDARGAQGGNFSPNTGGLGARAVGVVNVTPNQVLSIYVGGQGTASQNAAGGGGGSGVALGNTPLVVAGGGGGASNAGGENGQSGQTTTGGSNSSGAGGANGLGGQKGYVSGDCGWAGGGGGFSGNGYGGDGSWDGGVLPGTLSGPAAGFAALNGGAGGANGGCNFSSGQGNGGWGCGGGGRGEYGGGGGGGYSGGGAGQYVAGTGQRGGGGGGTFNSGANQTNTSGFQSGNGVVIISYIAGTAMSVTATPSVICVGGTATLNASGVVSYTWQGGSNSTSITVSPTTTTSYSVVGTNSLGCTSSLSINLPVNQGVPVLTLTTLPASGTLCAGKTATFTASGALSYAWAGNTAVTNGTAFVPGATGTWTVTGTNACGTSSMTTSLTVSPLPPVTASINNPTVCSGNSVTVNGGGAVTYTWSGGVLNNTPFVPAATGAYTVTGSSAVGCTATAVTNVTVLITPTVAPVVTPTAICIGSSATLSAIGATGYTWMPGPGSNTLNATNVVSPTSSTTYTLLRTNGACPSTATITLIVNPLPTFVATGSPSLICAGNSATLNAVGAISYTWLPAGFNSANVTVYPNSSTNYTLIASNGSCTANQTVSITVNPAPVLSISSSPTVICQGTAVTMTASGASTYTWLAAGSSPSTTAAAISVTPAISTQYTLTGTSSQGCVGSMAQVVVVNTAPTATATVLNPGGFICAGDVGTITAVGAPPISYSWSPGGAAAATFTAQPAVTTVYTLTTTNPSTGCQGTTTTTLSVNIATFNVTGGGPLCKGTSTTLIATGAANNYSWSTTATTSSITVTPLSTTNYYVTGFNGNCQSTQTVAITVNPIPNVIASAVKSTICRLEPAVLNASGAVTYSWSANAGGATTAAVTLTPNVTTTYSVVGTDANGCSKTAVVTQFVNACLGIEQLSGNVGDMLNIYPNPSNGAFTVKADGELNVSIINEVGQVVKTTVLNANNNYELNMGNMANGLYFVVAKKDGNTATKKVVVAK